MHLVQLLLEGHGSSSQGITAWGQTPPGKQSHLPNAHVHWSHYLTGPDPAWTLVLMGAILVSVVPQRQRTAHQEAGALHAKPDLRGPGWLPLHM